MNKVTKGALAAAAGAAILVGGAGTMAAWSDSAGDIGSSTVTAGKLDIAQVGTGAWTWSNGDPLLPNDKLVPGDVIKYTAKYNVTLDGTNLNADLDAKVGNVEGELAEFLLPSGTAGTGVTQNVTAGEHEVTTTLTFDPDLAGASGGMEQTATISGATVTLTQKL